MRMVPVHQKRLLRNAARRGFSLLELMVTITIVTLITGIVMFQYSAFDSTVLLKNQAFELALDIRDTQVRAISVRSDERSGAEFGGSYGLHFQKSKPNEYILFQDLNENGQYDGGEELATYNLDQRFYIDDLFFDGGTGTDIASVVFRRPNFDARIRSSASAPPAASVHIVIASVRNPSAARTVSVYHSGQISVD